MPEFSVQPFYRVKELVSFFSVTRQCVAGWCNLGKLDAIYLTSHAVVITGQSVKNWASSWKK